MFSGNGNRPWQQIAHDYDYLSAVDISAGHFLGNLLAGKTGNFLVRDNELKIFEGAFETVPR